LGERARLKGNVFDHYFNTSEKMIFLWRPGEIAKREGARKELLEERVL